MDSPGATRRSAACAVSEHGPCPHWMGFWLLAGGRALCHCPCHAGCPVREGSDQAQGQWGWWESCRCPGSESVRDGIRRRWHGKSPPSPEETRQFLKEEDDACTAAREAVSARSAGRSRAEIRQMFIGELRSRGRAVPDDLFLDFEADMIVNTIPPDASMFTAVKALVKMFLRGRALDRELAGGVTVTRAQDLRGPRGQAPYLVPPERSLPLADVILDPGAEAVLRPLGDEPVVSLERVSPGGAGPVVVYVGDQRVGTVGPRDGPRYGPALEAAQRAGRTLMVHGVFSQAQDGVARLQVYPAGIL